MARTEQRLINFEFADQEPRLVMWKHVHEKPEGKSFATRLFHPTWLSFTHTVLSDVEADDSHVVRMSHSTEGAHCTKGYPSSKDFELAVMIFDATPDDIRLIEVAGDEASQFEEGDFRIGRGNPYQHQLRIPANAGELTVYLTHRIC